MISFLFLLLFLVGCAALAVASCRRLAPETTGTTGLLARAVVGLSLVVVCSEAAGVLGGFVPWVLGAVGAALLLAAWRLDPGRPLPVVSRPDPSGSSVWVAVAACAAVLIAWSGPIVESLDGGIYRQDSLWYHLTLASGFVQDGQIGGLQITDPLKLAAWFYPQNAEIFHGLGMLALGDDFASPFLNLLWASLTLLAGWCIGRRLGRPGTGIAATALILVTPMMLTQAGNAPNDAAGLALVAAAIAMLLAANGDNSRLRPGPELAIAGLAAGLAVGTKLTLVVPVAVLGIGVVLLAGRGARPRAAGLWFFPAFLTGGFWYLRNLVITGNPFPWFAAGPLKGPDQLDIYPRPAHALSEYLGRPGDWTTELLPGLDNALGHAWPVLGGLAVAGLLICAFSRRDRILAVLAWAGLSILVVHLFTPISASGPLGDPSGFATNLRYVAAALLLGLTCVIGTARGRATGLVSTLIGFGLAVNLAGSLPGQGSALLALGFTVALAVLGFLVFRSRSFPVRTAAALAAVGLVWFSASATHSSYVDTRYAPDQLPIRATPGFRTSTDWVPIQAWSRTVDSARIGVVGPSGVFAQYLFHGRKLTNEVSYIGEEGPRGAMRPAPDCESWREAVNRFDPDFLVFTPPTDLGGELESQEAFWTRTDPAATEILRSTPASVFVVRDELDPENCENLRNVTMLPHEWGGLSTVPQNAFPEPPYLPLEELAEP